MGAWNLFGSCALATSLVRTLLLCVDVLKERIPDLILGRFALGLVENSEFCWRGSSSSLHTLVSRWCVVARSCSSMVVCGVMAYVFCVTGRPLRDGRTRVRVGEVGTVARAARNVIRD